jgi:hypothetical protein
MRMAAFSIARTLADGAKVATSGVDSSETTPAAKSRGGTPVSAAFAPCNFNCPENTKAAEFRSFEQCLKMERAKGFEPSTPTLATRSGGFRSSKY